VPAEVREGEVVIRLSDRRYRVRGLDKAMSYDSLRVNLLAARGEAFHVDTLELYSARQRAAFIKTAAEELALEEAVVKHDVGKVFAKLEELQEEQIQRTLAPKPATVAIEPAARDAALQLLRDPDLGRRRRRRVATLQERHRVLDDALRRHLPGWRWDPPRGGLSLWVDIGRPSEPFAQHALRHGVAVATPGALSASGDHDTRVRLSFAAEPAELEEGVARLTRAWGSRPG